MNAIFKMLSNLFSSKANIATLVFMVAAGYFLITEHTAHVLSAAPYLLLLACVGMHFFMHAGHGSHNHSEHKGDVDQEQEEENERLDA